MKLLAFETATEACSVALYDDGQVLERFEIAPRRHTELALPWAEALLAEAGMTRSQLDAVAIGRGPGAFTGVRLAIAIGQGIAFALNRPLIPVSTLAVLAAGSTHAHTEGARIAAAIDARMGEVYLGAFVRKNGDLVAQMDEVVVKPDAAVLPDGNEWHAVGTGFAAADQALQTRFAGRLQTTEAHALPRAAMLAKLAVLAWSQGKALAPERVEPAYLRNDVALTLAQQQARRA